MVTIVVMSMDLLLMSTDAVATATNCSKKKKKEKQKKTEHSVARLGNLGNLMQVSQSRPLINLSLL